MLRKLGFEDLDMDFDGYYRLDPAQRTLSVGVNMELRDIESMHFTATLADALRAPVAAAYALLDEQGARKAMEVAIG